MRKITNELILNFKKYLIEEEKSENTIEKYVYDVTFFMSWLSGQEITKILALEYKKELCEKYAPASVNASRLGIAVWGRAVWGRSRLGTGAVWGREPFGDVHFMAHFYQSALL